MDSEEAIASTKQMECSTCSSTRPKQLKSGGKYKHVKGSMSS